MATVAVDFDGVIHTYDKGWQDGSIYGDFVPGAVESISRLMSQYAVFIHTTRSPRQVARWIERQSGYAFECTTRFPRRKTFWNERGYLLVTNRKLPAVAYIDDRAIHFTSWNLALALLKARAGGGEPQNDQAPASGLDRVQEAVRRSRGGDAPVQFRGFALCRRCWARCWLPVTSRAVRRCRWAARGWPTRGCRLAVTRT